MHITCVPFSRLVAIVTVCALLGNGCTSMRPVAVVAPGAPQAPTAIKVGDHVRVTMRGGRTARFTVEHVDVSGITARDGEKYPMDEILTLERRSVSAAKTTLLIVSVVGGVYLVLYAIAAAAFVDELYRPPTL
jgi:hypothetical protein